VVTSWRTRSYYRSILLADVVPQLHSPGGDSVPRDVQMEPTVRWSQSCAISAKMAEQIWGVDSRGPKKSCCDGHIRAPSEQSVLDSNANCRYYYCKKTFTSYYRRHHLHLMHRCGASLHIWHVAWSLSMFLFVQKTAVPIMSQFEM